MNPLPAAPNIALMTRTFNLADLFEVVAHTVPDRIAFVCGAQRLSYRALDERATRLASALQAQGLRRGDHVGIALFNSAQYLEAFLACCKIGAVPANINYRYVAGELGFLLQSLDLKALFFEASLAPAVAPVLPGVATLRWPVCVRSPAGSAAPFAGALDYESLLASGSDHLTDPERSDQDRYLLCTGGTTGMPKGVIWTHRALFMGALGGGGIYQQLPPIAQAQDLAERVALAPHLTFLAIAPMMHGAALWSSLISLFAGHTVVVSEQTHFDAAHIWTVVQNESVNVMTVVGDSMALPLVQALEAEPARWALDSLMIFGNGGAMLSGHLQARLLALLPQLYLSNGMGSSETGVVGGGERPAQGEGFMVLKARPDLAVLSDDLRILRTPGERGVLARTGHTPMGYYGDAPKTAEVFVTIDGVLWVRSGDQARIDEQGDIVVLGRDSQCITTGGEKVFTEEVEEVLRRDPAVADVLVVGLPDARWGQQVTAVVALAHGAQLDPAALLAMSRQHLAGYKIPKAVYVAPAIRRSDAGKADYRWALEFAKAQADSMPAPSA